MGLHSLRGGRNELYIFGKGQGKEMEAQLMRKIKKVMDLLRVNWRTMAEFEILYKVLSLTIFTPIFLWVFNGIMKVTGYQYLTIENVFSFFLNPLTLLALLCFCHVGGRDCSILRRGVFETKTGGDRIGICGMGLPCGFPSSSVGIWHSGKLCLHQYPILWA